MDRAYGSSAPSRQSQASAPPVAHLVRVRVRVRARARVRVRVRVRVGD